MNDGKLWYMATPYTKYEHGLNAAFAKASEIASILIIRHGISLFSPIVHSHPIAAHGQIDPLNHDFWMNVDKPFMERCDGVIVVCMNGWTKSAGMRFEIDWFRKAGKPLRYYDPETDSLAGVV